MSGRTEKTRRQRIESLVSWAKENKIEPLTSGAYDKIFNTAHQRYPTMTKKTHESYTYATLYILREGRQR